MGPSQNRKMKKFTYRVTKKITLVRSFIGKYRDLLPPTKLGPIRAIRIHNRIRKLSFHSLSPLEAQKMWSCLCRGPMIRVGPMNRSSTIRRKPHNGVVLHLGKLISRGVKVRASMLDSSSSSSSSPDHSSKFAKRIEQAWLISQQPTPISCSSCNSNGHVECKWCAGTGFFIIGDNMLCEIPSRNTTCVICSGEGLVRCLDCQGTGFRAEWLGRPPNSE